MKAPWQIDWEWQEGIQKRLAMPIYKSVWPNAEIVEIDAQRGNDLAAALDIGGADKMLRFPDGGLAFLGQRFRRYNSWHVERDGYIKEYDDFTLRADRPLSHRKTEFEKILAALDRAGFTAGYYAYGHLTQDETQFARFRILRFADFIRYVLNNPLPYRIRNIDDSSRFFSWPFAEIPKEFIEYEEPTAVEPRQLTMF